MVTIKKSWLLAAQLRGALLRIDERIESQTAQRFVLIAEDAWQLAERLELRKQFHACHAGGVLAQQSAVYRALRCRNRRFERIEITHVPQCFFGAVRLAVSLDVESHGCIPLMDKLRD